MATGNVSRAVRRRFDLMTEVLGVDRRHAVGWTLGRVLQNVLWDLKSGDTTPCTGPDAAIAQVLLAR